MAGIISALGIEQVDAVLTLLVVGLMFIGFLREAYPAEVVAVSGVSVLLVLGVLPYAEALDVLSNPAPWTIGAMFVIMGALVRTGALHWFIGRTEMVSGSSPRMAIAILLLFVVSASAFVSNTPVVVVMIPVFTQLARTLNMAPSKLLE